MAVVRLELMAKHIEELEKRAKAKAEDLYYSDITVKGLSLRQRGGSIDCYMRYKGLQMVFGYVVSKDTRKLSGITEIQNLARRIKEEFDTGGKMYVDEYLKHFYKLKFGQKPTDHNEIKKAMRPEAKTWTLTVCFEQMIVDRTHASQVDSRMADTTIEDMRSTFRKIEFKTLMDMAVVNIKRGDVETSRDQVELRCGISPARKVVSHVRTVMSHSYDYHGGQSGLADMDKWWLLLKYGKKNQAKTRRPSVTEIAKTILLAEHFTKHPLPWSKINRAGFGREVFEGFKWICLTGQRSGAGVGVLCKDVKYASIDEYDDLSDELDWNGWKIARWGDEVMKGKKKYSLPIPPEVIAASEPMQWFGDRKYVFRSYLKNETPVSRYAVYGVCAKLAGVKEGKFRGKDYQLLAMNGINFYSPHDIRRTIVKVLEKARLPAGASAILAHEFTDMARTTLKNYSDNERLELKREAMEIWSKTVLNEIDRLRSEWQPVLSV